MDHALLDQLDHMIAQCERVLADGSQSPDAVQHLLDACRALRALLIEADSEARAPDD